MQAPDVAKRYWGLADDAGMRELLLAVRADEAGETSLPACCVGRSGFRVGSNQHFWHAH